MPLDPQSRALLQSTETQLPPFDDAQAFARHVVDLVAGVGRASHFEEGTRLNIHPRESETQYVLEVKAHRRGRVRRVFDLQFDRALEIHSEANWRAVLCALAMALGAGVEMQLH
jgi:stress response protein YsnF